TVPMLIMAKRWRWFSLPQLLAQTSAYSGSKLRTSGSICPQYSLRNILSLINYLYTEKHYNKARNMVSLYFSLYIDGEPNLRNNFMKSLNEFLASLDTNNSRQLRAFLDEIDNIAKEQTLTTYHKILMNLVLQNNVKVLTNVVYDFKSILEEDIDKLGRYKGFKKYVALGKFKRLEQQVLFILMQCLLKSIEISHYSSVGFLVKYLITNFKAKEINEAFLLLKENPNIFTDEKDRVHSIGENDDEDSEKSLLL
ncbi:hypothetical protein AAIB49_08955, partial [Ornithinibacillus sp. JPR2-1]